MADREYRLVVAGELSDHLAAAFDGMTLTRTGENTELVGHVADQTALQGLLQRVSELGLTLLTVTTQEDGEAVGDPDAAA